MLKFALPTLCLVFLLSRQVLTLAIDSNENQLIDVDSNSTSLEPQNVGLYVNNKVFYVNLVRVNWLSAAEQCSSQNQILASINSEEDNTRLVQKLRDSRLLFNGAKFWIGASNLGHEDYYAWLGSGSPVTYTNWRPGQPDNAFNGEHCAELLPDGRWNDIRCDALNFVICENRCALTSYDVPTYTK